jgi:hypothetical protein
MISIYDSLTPNLIAFWLIHAGCCRYPSTEAPAQLVNKNISAIGHAYPALIHLILQNG